MQNVALSFQTVISGASLQLPSSRIATVPVSVCSSKLYTWRNSGHVTHITDVSRRWCRPCRTCFTVSSQSQDFRPGLTCRALSRLGPFPGSSSTFSVSHPCDSGLLFLLTIKTSAARQYRPLSRSYSVPACYSYRRASAGRIRAADQDGYRVATNETRTANRATHRPSARRGANGT